MSWESQEDFISLIGEEMKLKIRLEAEKANVIGIITDTTPEVSNIDQLTVAIRYIDENGEVKERLLKTTDVHDKTGEGMSRKILDCVQQNGLDSSLIRFQTYDSASSISSSRYICITTLRLN